MGLLLSLISERVYELIKGKLEDNILLQFKKKDSQGRQVVSHSNGLSNGLKEEKRAEKGKKKKTLVLAGFQKKETETKKERREVVPDLD